MPWRDRGGVDVVLLMMQCEDNPLVELARRARTGDFVAAEEFRQEMSLALEGMVRLALRKRICLSSFEQNVRARARRLQQSNDWQIPHDELARRTAGQVCDDMIDRLQVSRRQDTVAGSGRFGKDDTVVESR